MKKFLFVGVGGSGNKTLRFLKRSVARRLEELGYAGPMPRAYQFVSIDLDEQDSDLEAPLLDREEFVRLAARNVTYTEYDRELAMSEVAVAQREFATWRPDPSVAPPYPYLGAGQYRAVGRAVALASLPTIIEAMSQRLKALEDLGVGIELAEVASTIGQVAEPTNPVGIFVVASLAGGTGAAAFIDVCDVIKASREDGTGQVNAVLFAPEVFESLSPDRRRGTQPNALAGISELTNAMLEKTGEFPAPHVTAAGGGVPGDRGPAFAFVVGASNGHVRFTSQVDAYAAVAGSLATMVVTSSTQATFDKYVLANDPLSAGLPVRPVLLRNSYPKPMMALGFAQLSLGRHRFQEYAGERIARGCVEHLLMAHHDDAVRAGTKTAKARLQEVVDDVLVRRFMTACGLNELSPENNQVIDAIQQPKEFQRQAKALAKDVFDSAKGTARRSGPEWVKRIVTQLDGKERPFVRDRQAAMATAQAAWLRTVQGQIVDATNDLVAARGLAVTVQALREVNSLLDHAAAELGDELSTESRSHREAMGNLTLEAGGLLEAIDIEHGQLKRLIGQHLRRHIESADNATARELAAEAIERVKQNFLRPLLRELDGHLEALQDEIGSGAIADWATHSSVPARLAAAPYEVFPEPTETYPDLFEKVLRSTVGGEGSPDHQVVGAALRHDGGVVDFTPWIGDAVAGQQPQPASFRVQLDTASQLRRASDWMADDPTSGIGAYLRQTLGDFLDDPAANAAERKRRVADFGRCLTQVLERARPLANVDETYYKRIHGADPSPPLLLISPIPFGPGHPARDAARKALIHAGVKPDDADALFRVGPVRSIDVSSFQSPSLHPMVFGSVVTPIKRAFDAAAGDSQRSQDFWRHRRARVLAESIPLDREGIDGLVRGWLVAGMLGLLEVRPGASTILERGGGQVAVCQQRLARVSDESHELASVLESLQIALADFVTGGNSALQGYERLLELGGGRDAVLPPELQEWIEGGEAVLGPGAVVDGSDEASRREAAMADLDRTLTTMDRIQEEFDLPEHFVRPDLRFDTAVLVNRAATQLRSVIAEHAQLRKGGRSRGSRGF